MAGSYEHGNELSAAIKVRNTLGLHLLAWKCLDIALKQVTISLALLPTHNPIVRTYTSYPYDKVSLREQQNVVLAVWAASRYDRKESLIRRIC
jgi:hypothetical protein